MTNLRALSGLPWPLAAESKAELSMLRMPVAIPPDPTALSKSGDCMNFLARSWMFWDPSAPSANCPSCFKSTPAIFAIPRANLFSDSLFRSSEGFFPSARPVTSWFACPIIPFKGPGTLPWMFPNTLLTAFSGSFRNASGLVPPITLSLYANTSFSSSASSPSFWSSVPSSFSLSAPSSLEA